MKTVEELEKEIKEIENKVNVTTKEYQDTMKSHVENMEKILQELKKNKNTFEPTPKDWKPKDGEKYYYSSGRLKVCTVIFDDSSIIDNEILKYNQVFRIEEECQLYCDIQRAFRDASREFIYKERNYYLWYDCEDGVLALGSDAICKNTPLYFDSKETIQNLINKFGEENIKRYYLGVY